MLIVMPVLDTETNGRAKLTKRSLSSLLDTITRNDRVIVSDNGSCSETLNYLRGLAAKRRITLIENGRNLGIADAVNQGWRYRRDGESACKIDNDCVIQRSGWTVVMERVFQDNPDVGILGLKRKDLEECPDAEHPFYRSRLFFANREHGDPWVVLEEARHIMGTCYAFSYRMLPEFGYLMQPGTLYGFDDGLAAVRAHKLGFKTCFLHGYEIDHIDEGEKNPYAFWKDEQASKGLPIYNLYARDIAEGRMSPYYDGGF